MRSEIHPMPQNAARLVQGSQTPCPSNVILSEAKNLSTLNAGVMNEFPEKI
jgi:hypothetical protein